MTRPAVWLPPRTISVAASCVAVTAAEPVIVNDFVARFSRIVRPATLPATIGVKARPPTENAWLTVIVKAVIAETLGVRPPTPTNDRPPVSGSAAWISLSLVGVKAANPVMR